MSLVTTCPACATSFLLKPEHLAAHRGDVRCGQCDFVFNALDKLGETVEIPPTETPVPEVTEPLAETTVEPITEAEVGITEPAVAEPEITWPEIIEPQTQVEIESSADITEAPPETPPTTLDDDPFSTTAFDEIAQKPAEDSVSGQLGDAFDQTDFTNLAPPAETETSISDTPSPHADLTDYRIEPVVTETDLVDAEPEKSGDISVAGNSLSTPEPYERPNTFIDSISTSAKPAPEKRNARKWLLIILAVILTIAALAQATYYLRTQLSIMLPGLKPYLVQACAKLGCTIELPKNIKLLVIDDSSIQEDTEHADVIHLSSTLINNAEFPQAYPLLELTLTDANDAPALRRTFKPSEYLPPSTKISDGIPAGEELHINLALTTNGEKVSGYRVQVNY